MPEKTLKILLAGLFSLFLLATVILGLYFSFFRYGGIGTLNLRSDMSLRIDPVKIKAPQLILQQSRGKILFVLSSGFKEINERAAGHNISNKGAYFAELKRLGGISIVILYLDKKEWLKIPEAERDLILTIFIYQQIQDLRGLPSQTLNDLTDTAFSQGAPILLKERFQK